MQRFLPHQEAEMRISDSGGIFSYFRGLDRLDIVGGGGSYATRDEAVNGGSPRLPDYSEQSFLFEIRFD